MGLVFPYLRTSEMFELLADPVLIMADYSRAHVLRLGKLNKLSSVHYYADLDAEILTGGTCYQCCIPDPGSKNNKRELKKYLLSYFFFVKNFTKLNLFLFLKC
jgi:hypothetical protein